VPVQANAVLVLLDSAVHAIDSLVFDLDGTLWDTCAACAIGWNNVLRRHAIAFREISAADVRSVAGKPHDACIRQVFAGLPEEQLAILSDETAREDNAVIAALGGVLYAGVPDGLARLAAHYPLFIVSNCQAGYIETFVRVHGFAGLFRDFECWGNTGLSKAENLARVIQRNRLVAPLFVGDTLGDLQAAEACHTRFVHAAYGFGVCADAQLTAASFAELCDSLLAAR
jgi:phosphoglycolate phosphatase